jgi:hypothetical protein
MRRQQTQLSARINSKWPESCAIPGRPPTIPSAADLLSAADIHVGSARRLAGLAEQLVRRSSSSAPWWKLDSSNFGPPTIRTWFRSLAGAFPPRLHVGVNRLGRPSRLLLR